MKIRLGYVAISKTLEPQTTSSTITYTNFIKTKDYQKLDNIIKSNLSSLIEILRYNEKNNIHFYRISSSLIPLATKNDVIFNYLEPYSKYYQNIKNIIQRTNIRLDFHPSTYVVLNSVKQEVVTASIKNLEYHYKLLKEMNIKNKRIIIHVGSGVFGKKNSLTRFINNFKKIPPYLQKVIAIENDDKIFTIDDCLYLNKTLNIPVVLDVHHFNCNNTGKKLTSYLEDIFATWQEEIPKIHFSSPKNKKEYRSHHDYINIDEFLSFLTILKKTPHDIDIMLEAKAKDEALFRLTRQLKYKTNYTFLDETTILLDE